MVYQSFLIKYAEIGTKGKNRYLFEDALIKQIKNALKKVEGSFIASKESGRIYVQALSEYDYDEVIDALKKVFGIAWICPMLQLEDKDYENLKKVVVDYIDQVYPDKHFTFKVDSRRADKNYPVRSEQMNCDFGEVILNAFPETSGRCAPSGRSGACGNPQSCEHLLPDDSRSGGMPVGTNGKATCFYPAASTARVAGYMIAKQRREDRRGLLPCSAIHQRPRKAEGGGSGKAGSALFRPDSAACGKLYRHSAVYLRAVPA